MMNNTGLGSVPWETPALTTPHLDRKLLMHGIIDLLTPREFRNEDVVINAIEGLLKGKWQQKFLSAYLKETPKQYIEAYYRIFISALFGKIF